MNSVSSYPVTNGILFALNNDSECGNSIFALQYLPDMIQWIKFVHSRLNGRLSKKDLRYKNPKTGKYHYTAEWLLDKCKKENLVM